MKTKALYLVDRHVPRSEHFGVHTTLNGQNHILRRKHRLDDKIMYMREVLEIRRGYEGMERRVTHAAKTFSVEREFEERNNLRCRNEERKGDQIKESMHFEAREGRKRDDHKQRGNE